VVQEFALVANLQLIPTPFAHTRIVLTQPLVNCYDRTVTTVNANVGPATGGGSVTELLGSGAAATPNQAFTLKQSPLTYTQAATPSGSVSSLEVTVSGAAWQLVPTLYGQAPNAQVYAAINQSSGNAVVQFGDGVEGATVPTGQNNIMANYRVGIGSAGNVAAGSITTLVDRPVGVSGVTNPMPATGGQDPQSVDDIRANAPLSVLTLGRAVSITDYQNFAVTFAGISKASALWVPNGSSRGVFVTVAGVSGASVANTQTQINLTNALLAYGNPQIAVNVQSFYETIFNVTAAIAYDPAYDVTAVNNAVTAALLGNYSFASRDFGQGVSADEVATLIQGVAGVIAVNVTQLNVVATSAAGDIGSTAISVSAWNNWIAQKVTVPRPSAGPARICPYVPTASASAPPLPAEILVLDPDPSAVVLEVMQ
jgi:predicted phage baseplate assembly protein